MTAGVWWAGVRTGNPSSFCATGRLGAEPNQRTRTPSTQLRFVPLGGGGGTLAPPLVFSKTVQCAQKPVQYHLASVEVYSQAKFLRILVDLIFGFID